MIRLLAKFKGCQICLFINFKDLPHNGQGYIVMINNANKFILFFAPKAT